MSGKKILLVYDKECPACDYYCNIVRIQESVGELVIVNARDDTEVMKEITDMNLDIDQGMVVKIDSQIYYGSDAIHILALMGSRSNLFNRFNRRLFSSKKLSSVLYPILKFLRNILLKILGVGKINNLNKAGNDHF